MGTGQTRLVSEMQMMWGVARSHPGDMSEALKPRGPSGRTLAIAIRVCRHSPAQEEEHSNQSSH